MEFVHRKEDTIALKKELKFPTGKAQVLVTGTLGGKTLTLPLEVVGASGVADEDPWPPFCDAVDSDLLRSFSLPLDPQNRTIAQ